MTIDDLTKALEKLGHTVEWPVTGKLLLDGRVELDVERYLMDDWTPAEAARELSSQGMGENRYRITLHTTTLIWHAGLLSPGQNFGTFARVVKPNGETLSEGETCPLGYTEAAAQSAAAEAGLEAYRDEEGWWARET